MRFTGPDDETLPPRIRALAKERRVTFVDAYNAAGDDPEQAMKAAMTAIEDTLCRCGKELEIAKGAEKAECDSCRRNYKVAWRDVKDDGMDMCCPVLAEVYKPLGGATSFAEADQFYAAAEIDNNVWQQRYTFEDICRNTWDSKDLSMTEKAAAIARAAQDLATRIAAGPDNTKSFADKAKGILRGFRTMTKEENGVGYKATDYADVPDDQDPSTWKVRLADEKGAITVSSVAGAIRELQPKGYAERLTVIGDAKATVMGKLDAAITQLEAPPWQKSRLRERLATVKQTAEPGAFFVTKDVDGAWRWLALFTNHWKDRDGEIFATAAHREFEGYVDRTKEYPEAWVWHVPGTAFGDADIVTYDDKGFMFAAGTFRPGMEYVAERLAAIKEPLGVSHGYEYLDSDLTDHGVYERYRTREISVLPMSKAANQWTLFSTEKVKEADIMFNPDKRPMIAQILGEGKTSEIETLVDAAAKQLDAGGMAYKEFYELLTPPPTPAAKAEGEAAPAAAAETIVASSNTHSVPPEPLTLEAITGAINAAIEPLRTDLAAVQGEVKELQKTKDESVADAVGGKKPLEAARASESTSTELSAEQQEAAAKALNEDAAWKDSPIAPFMAHLLGKEAAGMPQG